MTVAFPDTLVGTDSHTTMINGLGVVGWGVGGIEAEAVMLGQPLYMLMPEVVGFRLTGRLRDGVTATDLVLTVTQMLRKKGVVDKFVEFYGPGCRRCRSPTARRSRNMAPEYGATIGFFPVDDETLRYLERTNRARRGAAARGVRARSRACSAPTTRPSPTFTDTLELDLGDVEPSLAGPKRPQDRVRAARHEDVVPQGADRAGQGARLRAGRGRARAHREESCSATAIARQARPRRGGDRGDHLVHEHVEPVGDGRRGTAREEGGRARAHGAAVREDEPRAGLEGGDRVPARGRTLAPLEALGFDIVGYGCTTCIADGTPVLLADGTARRIEDLPLDGGAACSGRTRIAGWRQRPRPSGWIRAYASASR